MPEVPQLSMSTFPSSVSITTTATTATSSLLSLPPIIMNTKKHYGEINSFNESSFVNTIIPHFIPPEYRNINIPNFTDHSIFNNNSTNNNEYDPSTNTTRVKEDTSSTKSSLSPLLSSVPIAMDPISTLVLTTTTIVPTNIPTPQINLKSSSITNIPSIIIATSSSSSASSLSSSSSSSTNNNITNNQSIPIKTISDNNNDEMKRITPSPPQEELQQEEEVVVAAVSSSQNEMIPFITRSCLKDFIHSSSSSTNTDNNKNNHNINNNINNKDIDLIFTFAVETKMEILPTKAASTTVSSSSSSPFLSSKDVLYNYHLRQNTNNIHLSNILIDNIAHYLLRNCNNDDGNDNDNDDDDDDSDEELLLSLENSTSSLMTSSLSTLSSSTSSSSSSIVVKDTKEKMNKMKRKKFQKKKNGNEILLKTKISVIYYSKHDGLLDIASCASIHPQATHCKIVRAHLKLGKSYNAIVDTTNAMMDENAIINLALKGLQNDMKNGHIIDSRLKTQEKKSSSLSAESKSSTFLPSTDHLMNLRYLGPNIKFNHIFNDLEQEGGGIFNIGDTLINNLPKESSITSQKGNNNTIYYSKRIGGGGNQKNNHNNYQHSLVLGMFITALIMFTIFLIGGMYLLRKRIRKNKEREHRRALSRFCNNGNSMGRCDGLGVDDDVINDTNRLLQFDHM